MKAEQRKELETNALADRMGNLMQRMKAKPERGTLYYVIGMVVVVIAFVVVVRWFQMDRRAAALNWQLLDSGNDQKLVHLVQKEGKTNAGKAARFQLAWVLYWEFGVKRLGVGMAGGHDAVSNINRAFQDYQKLADECADDKVWGPEALYGQAVIMETKAVMSIANLDEAKKLYENLRAKYPDSARGKLAAEWLENYDNVAKRDELSEFYQRMHTALNIRDLDALQRMLQQQKGNLVPPGKKAAK